MDFGKRLRQERERQGLGVRELARQAGVSPAMVSRIESAGAVPTIVIARKLARVLRVSLDYLAETFEPDREYQATSAA